MKCCHPSGTVSLAQCGQEQVRKRPQFESDSRRIRADFAKKGRRAAGPSTRLDLVVNVSEHDPEKWEPAFGNDHAQTKINTARRRGCGWSLWSGPINGVRPKPRQPRRDVDRFDRS